MSIQNMIEQYRKMRGYVPPATEAANSDTQVYEGSSDYSIGNSSGVTAPSLIPTPSSANQLQGYQQAADANLGGAALSGGLSGAAAGTSIMPGWGTVIGAGVGAVSSLVGAGLQGQAEKEKADKENALIKEKNDREYRMRQQELAQNSRTQNMTGMQFLAQQRSEAQKDANLHAFRNAMLA
jgi:outer membrane lipoprotein SlyB